jgi:hypothetical protein
MILNSESPIRMVRELKGAPLSILMVLTLVDQRVSKQYLERATGYTDKPINHALAYMREVGLVDQTNSGWQLIKEKIMQPPLTLEIEEGDSSPKSHSIKERGLRQSIANDLCERGSGREEGVENRNNSDSLITTTLNINDLKDSVVVSSNNATNRKNSVFDINLEEFKQCGIAKNKRTESLARMEHVNPDYIRAHLKALKKNETKGLAIMRMEQGEDPPQMPIVLTDAEKRAKYSEWER